MGSLRNFAKSTAGTVIFTAIITALLVVGGVVGRWAISDWRWVNQQRKAIEQQQLMQSGANQVIEQIKKQQGGK